ncbi:hypothetical protein [Leptospira weilii]|uniref:hypothetical protein n=1 Tax=Leptospira weilii TaxID=28184 RepID=UPI0007748AF7|nr:hypothetical protein [Leptospira weilii]
MFNGIKQYKTKTRFAGAVSIFGIAAFLILFYWKSNFGSAHNLSTTTLDSALEWSFEPERKLESESGSFRIPEKSENLKSGYEDKQLRNVLSDFLKESELKKENNTTLNSEITKIKKTKEESKEFKNLEPDVRNPSEATENTELVTNSNDSSNTKIQDMWELPQEETHSTNDLEITGAWEASAELASIEEAEIRNREKVTNLEPQIGFSDIETGNGSEENEKKSAIKRQTESNNLSKSDFLNRNSVTVSADFSSQQSEKETIDRVSNLNPDRVLKNRTSTLLESKVDFVSWEMEADTFEIRILENVNIEFWAWNHIREKLDEIKNKTFKSNAPSLFAIAKEMLLYFPRRDESRRKSRPNPNKQDFVFENPGNVRKDSNSLILNHSLEIPNINRKQMRYYAIRTNGPPPTEHKQV